MPITVLIMSDQELLALVKQAITPLEELMSQGFTDLSAAVAALQAADLALQAQVAAVGTAVSELDALVLSMQAGDTDAEAAAVAIQAVIADLSTATTTVQADVDAANASGIAPITPD